MKKHHVDDQQLRLLSVFHYGLALFNLSGLLVGAFYVWFGASFERIAGRPQPGLEQTFLWMGIVIALLSVISAVTTGLAGWFIARRRHRGFCLVAAGLNALNMPLGTVLAVFTFVVLLRRSVVDQFDGARPTGELRGPLKA